MYNTVLDYYTVWKIPTAFIEFWLWPALLSRRGGALSRAQLWKCPWFSEVDKQLYMKGGFYLIRRGGLEEFYVCVCVCIYILCVFVYTHTYFYSLWHWELNPGPSTLPLSYISSPGIIYYKFYFKEIITFKNFEERNVLGGVLKKLNSNLWGTRIKDFSFLRWIKN